MSRRVEDLRQIFDDALVIPVIEQNIGRLQTLIATGSVITEAEFDRRGSNTSDVDYIAIVAKNFKNKSIPGWETMLSQDNILQTEGEVQGRRVHLRAYSKEQVDKALNELLTQITAKSLRDLYLPLWVLGREMAEGVIIRGSLPDHQFFKLYRNPPPSSNIDLLKDAIPFYYNER